MANTDIPEYMKGTKEPCKITPEQLTELQKKEGHTIIIESAKPDPTDLEAQLKNAVSARLKDTQTITDLNTQIAILNTKLGTHKRANDQLTNMLDIQVKIAMDRQERIDKLSVRTVGYHWSLVAAATCGLVSIIWIAIIFFWIRLW